MGKVEEFLIGEAHRRGLILFVDTDGRLVYYPKRNMSQGFLKILNKHYYRLKYYLITEAVTVE